MTHNESLNECPNCGGPADNGHDRSHPPTAYWCTKCMNKSEPPILKPCIFHGTKHINGTITNFECGYDCPGRNPFKERPSEIPLPDEAAIVKIMLKAAAKTMYRGEGMKLVLKALRPYLRPTMPVIVAPVSLEVGAKRIEHILDISYAEPQTDFNSTELSKACAEAWGLKYVD